MTETRVLIVEDEQIVALDMRKMLEELGYQVIAVTMTGEEAIELARRERPDLVLMDIQLGGEVTGVQAAKEILSDVDVPIIFVTAFADEDTLARIRTTQAYGYVLKPFEERELVGNIEIALHKHKIDRRLREREAFFRALIENDSDVAFVMNKAGEAHYVSPSVERILGYSPGECMNASVFRFVHPDDRAEVEHAFARIALGEDKGPLRVFRVRHKNGAWRYLETISSNRSSQPGVMGIVVNARDITDRITAENALRASEQQAHEQRELAEALREAGMALSANLNLGRIYDLLLLYIFRVVPFDIGQTLILRDGAAHIERVFRRNDGGVKVSDDVEPVSYPLAEVENLRWMTENHLPMVVPNCKATRGRLCIPDPDAGSWVGAPIIAQGQVIGFFSISKMEPGFYQVKHANRLAAFAAQSAIALMNANLYSQVERLAVTDALTGAFNRRHFFFEAGREMERCRRYGRPLSILMIDIDHFKRINDRYGHLAGDRVLQDVAELCRQDLREIDLLARYGGEEFIIALPETSTESAAHVAERLRRRIEQHICIVDDQDIQVTISGGLAGMSERSKSLEKLLEYADNALYQAKLHGRNRIDTWDE